MHSRRAIQGGGEALAAVPWGRQEAGDRSTTRHLFAPQGAMDAGRSLCQSDGLSVGPRYQAFRAPFFRLGCISVVALSLWPSEPRWQLANDLCHIMIQQPVSTGWYFIVSALLLRLLSLYSLGFGF